jgi:hypothetical protein
VPHCSTYPAVGGTANQPRRERLGSLTSNLDARSGRHRGSDRRRDVLVLLPSTGGLTSSTENGHRPVAKVPVSDRCPPMQPQRRSSSLHDGEFLLG